MNALEVSIDGTVVGVFVPPADSTFAAMLGNVPRTYMRGQVMSGNEKESWQWQLPDVRPGQIISFRMVDAPLGSGVSPQFVRAKDASDVDLIKKEAKRAYAEAKKALNKKNGKRR